MVVVNDAHHDDEPSWGSFLAVLCQSHYEFFHHKHATPTPEEALNSLDMACSRIPGADVHFDDPKLVEHVPDEFSHIRYATDPHPSLGLGMLILIAFGDQGAGSLDDLLKRYSPSGEFGDQWRSRHEAEVLQPFLSRYNLKLLETAA